MIASDKKSRIVYWVKPQNTRIGQDGKKEFYGHGKLLFIIRSNHYLVEVRDRSVVAVICKDTDKFASDSSYVSRRLREMGIVESKRESLRKRIRPEEFPLPTDENFKEKM